MTVEHKAAPAWLPFVDHGHCRRCGQQMPCNGTDDGTRPRLGLAQQEATAAIAQHRGWAA